MFKTSDIYLGAYLKAIDHDLVCVEKDRKSIFCFKVNKKLEKDKLEYYNGKGNIEPLKYSNAIKTIKSIAFSS